MRSVPEGVCEFEDNELPTKRKAQKKPAAAAVSDPRSPIKPSPAACQQTVVEVRRVLEQLPVPEQPAPADLVHAMLHIFFADGVVCGYGQESVRRVEEGFVNRNEFRVTEAFEVTELLEDLEIPGLFERCAAVRDAVGQVYSDQNTVSLDFLSEASVTDRNRFFQRTPSRPSFFST